MQIFLKDNSNVAVVLGGYTERFLTRHTIFRLSQIGLK